MGPTRKHIRPFRIQIPKADLEDLRERLARTRWPEELPGAGWEEGVPVGYLKELVDYWLTSYDWRAREARLNELPQFTTAIDGLDLHFVHVRSAEPEALPLIITHGWPGSVVELTEIIGPLADPRAHGGDPGDAFHVVAPSIPGFGFSGRPREPGWNLDRITAAFAELMERLGYRRYGAHGGAFGSLLSPELGRRYPDRLVGVHVNGFLSAPPRDPAQLEALTDEERERLEALRRFQRKQRGHAVIQATRPQTLAYALTDSPVGQLAWIVEKFREWTDSAEVPEDAVDRDQMLTNVTLYWLTATAGSSARLYKETADLSRAKRALDGADGRRGLPGGARCLDDQAARRSQPQHRPLVGARPAATSRRWRSPTCWSATCGSSSAASARKSSNRSRQRRTIAMITHEPQTPVRGSAAGVPYVALAPDQRDDGAPLVVAWHLASPPRSETAMAAALPLRGLDAWRVYLGLPMLGQRLPEGGLDEFFRRFREDMVLNVLEPVTREAVEELPAALAELRERLPIGDGPLGLIGGSTGAWVAQRVLADTDLPVSAAALVSPAIRLASVVERYERLWAFEYPWSERSRAVADRLDFVARADELAAREAPTLLVVGAEDDGPGFREPAERLRAALSQRSPERAALVEVPEMGHPLAEEPGLEPAPQSAHAAQVDAAVTGWFRRHLTDGAWSLGRYDRVADDGTARM